MPSKKGSTSLSRRRFLASTGSLIAAAPVAARGVSLEAQPSAPEPAVPATARKIPIGVFDPVYNHLSLDEMLDKISALGLEAVEIGTGGYPGTPHCPVADMLADPAKARAWKKKFTDRNIQVATLSCHGNPVHPDPKIAARDAETFRRTVKLAEMLDVQVIVGFSGCPGGSAKDTMPNWATYRWPPEFDQTLKYQWDDVVIPYWKEAAKFARENVDRAERQNAETTA